MKNKDSDWSTAMDTYNKLLGMNEFIDGKKKSNKNDRYNDCRLRKPPPKPKSKTVMENRDVQNYKSQPLLDTRESKKSENLLKKIQELKQQEQEL